MRMIIFLAELNGKEFQGYGYEDHLMLIVKTLYDLKTCRARFHEKFAEIMCQLGFMPSKADSDVQMKDFKDHWDNLKGVSEPTYHLGGDFKRVTEPESML
eukprot:2777212-Ditylum_brightwellii.AAC.1